NVSSLQHHCKAYLNQLSSDATYPNRVKPTCSYEDPIRILPRPENIVSVRPPPPVAPQGHPTHTFFSKFGKKRVRFLHILCNFRFLKANKNQHFRKLTRKTRAKRTYYNQK